MPEPTASTESPAPTPVAEPYWCFLSYRHADNKTEGRQWATWLHQAIETYEVPSEFVGVVNDRGDTIPERIFPVFRDEEELPADAKLDSPIYRALDRSRFLVVLCSPRAVASTYVDDEIRYFKKNGGADRILAAMLEGEPNASWDQGKRAAGIAPERECFPLALQHPVDAEGRLITAEHAEPIAADFRLGETGEQGWTSPEAYRRALAANRTLTPKGIEERVAAYRRQCELAKLKIIAGILGLPLGKLTRRDAAYQLAAARRRSRILRRWLAAVGVLAGLAVVGGLFAWQQRERAVEQRGIAEQQTVIATAQEREATIQRSKAQEHAAATEVVNGRLKVQLHEASLADWSRARALVEGKDWPQAMAYLGRALRYEPENRFARSWLWSEMVYGWGNEFDGNQRDTLPDRVLTHPESVVQFCFLPANNHLLTIDAKGTIRRWNAATGELLNASPATVGPLAGELVQANPAVLGPDSTVTFHPDGSRVLTISGRLVQQWDTATGHPIGEPLAHAFPPKTAAFDRSGKRILTFIPAATDTMLTLGSAHLWDATTGAPIGEPLRLGTADPSRFPGPQATVPELFASVKSRAEEVDRTLAQAFFSPDGSRVLTLSRGKLAQLWDSATGAPCGEPLLHAGPIHNALFTPDSSHLLTTSGTAGHWWNTKTGQLARTATPGPFHEGRIAFDPHSPPGLLLGFVIEKEYRVLRTFILPWFKDPPESITPETRGLDYKVIAADFAANSDIVTISDSGRLKTWHDQSPISVGDLPGFSTLPAISGTAAHFAARVGDKDVAIWDQGAATTCFLTLRHIRPIQQAGFSADGQRLLVVANDRCSTQGQIATWDLTTGRHVGPLILHDHSFAEPILFSPDFSRALLTGKDPQTAHLYDLVERRWVGTPLIRAEGFQHAAFTADSQYVIIAPPSPSAAAPDPSASTTAEGEASTVTSGNPLHSPHARIWAAIRPARPENLLTGVRAKEQRPTTTTASPAAPVPAFTPAHPVPRPEPRGWTTRNGELLTLPPGSGTEAAPPPAMFGGLLFTTDGKSRLSTVPFCSLTDHETSLPLTANLSILGITSSGVLHPNGRQAISRNGTQQLQVWELPPALPLPPSWLGDFVETLSGYRFNEHGEVTRVDLRERLDKRERLRALFRSAPQAGTDTAWEDLARWALTPLSERTLSPGSSLLVRNLGPHEPFVTPEMRVQGPAVNLFAPDADYWAKSAAERLAKRSHDYALEDAERALEINPEHPGAQRTKAAALRIQGRGDEALAVWRVLLATNKVLPDDFIVAGFLAAELNRREVTVAIFQQAEERIPGDAPLALWRGRALLLVDLPQEGLAAYRQAEERYRAAGREPSGDLLVGYIMAHWLSGQKNDATATYQQLIAKDPRYSDAEGLPTAHWFTEKELAVLQSALAETLRRHPQLKPTRRYDFLRRGL